MSCWIEWREHQLLISNRHFSDLIGFAIEVSRRSLRTDDERMFVDRMVQLSKDEFWPGRGIQIENDLPDIEERKFWARVFGDTARAIFRRELGNQEHSFWQAGAIYRAYRTSEIFTEAVRSSETGWTPETIDSREFDQAVNQRDRD